MLFNKKTQLINYFLVLILLILINNSVLAKTKQHTQFTIDNIHFTPEFVSVREQNEILVSVKVGNNYPGRPYKKLLLEQQKSRPNGGGFFKFIATLRDDGLNGDAIAGDSIYSARVSFIQKVTSNLQLRIVAKTKLYRKKHVSDVFTLPVRNACGPTGTILPVNILTPSSDKSYKATIQFIVPGSSATPRETILRIVNGAEINAPIKKRVNRAIFTLNNKRLFKLRKLTNIVEIPVILEQGLNTLEISRLLGNTEQRVAVDIKACADQITLTPISDTLLADKDSLLASATITAQGLPVEGAGVNFNVTENLVIDNQKSVFTTDNGIAQTQFELAEAGIGQLDAVVAETSPLLSVNRPIQIISEPSIKLNQGFNSITLAPGETKTLPYFLFYLAKNSPLQHLSYDTSIEPDNTGLTIKAPDTSTDNISVTGPNSFVFEPTVTALAAGDYVITAHATVFETGETISRTTEIHVVEAGSPEPLSINLPGLMPSAIAPVTATSVNIHALIEGTSTPPVKLIMDEVDAEGNIVTPEIAELKDEGTDGDSVANDYIYSAQIIINKAMPQNVLLRARAEYFGQEIISDIVSLLVTPFDTVSPPADLNELVEDPSINDKIFSNEILVKIIEGTSPDRIEEIANSINGEVLSVIPELQLYRIRFIGNGTLLGVEQAIASVVNFSEVISASKNSLVEIAGSSCSPSDCPDVDPNGQWHLKQISTKEAWNTAKVIDSVNFAGSPDFKVAVVDYGVDCSNSKLSSACTKVGSETSTHGTEVAGIIAAGDTGNSQDGATGVAWNTALLTYYGGGDFNKLLETINAAGAGEAKILNISMTKPIHFTQVDLIKDIRDSVCSVAKRGKLIVAAVGQPTTADKDLYPAKLNDDSSYQCEGSSVVLASHILSVGASDRDDKLARWDGKESNRVNWVDLYAPGIEIKAFSNLNNGTSFATPQVTASAAMLWPIMTPNTDANTIHDRLLANADIIDVLSNGSGDKRLNICNAIPQSIAPVENVVTINFVTESADFRNMFGIYDRTTLEARILIENVDLNSNPDLSGFQTTLTLTDEQLNNLEFFIIPNGGSPGFTVNQNYLQNTADSDRKLKVVKDQNSNIYRLKDDVQGVTLNGSNVPALFSETVLNSGNNVQVRNRSGDTEFDFHLDWEDIPLTSSDQDYNDAIFRITIAR